MHTFIPDVTLRMDPTSVLSDPSQSPRLVLNVTQVDEIQEQADVWIWRRGTIGRDNELLELFSRTRWSQGPAFLRLLFNQAPLSRRVKDGVQFISRKLLT